MNTKDISPHVLLTSSSLCEDVQAQTYLIQCESPALSVFFHPLSALPIFFLFYFFLAELMLSETQALVYRESEGMT